MHLARLAITCLVLLLTAFGSLPLHTLAQDDVTLRDADTAVIAQGVAALPAPQAVWSVRRPEAETVDDSSTATRNLGFTLDTDGLLLVADQGTGVRSRLSRGEAVFTSQGSSQVVTSLGDDETDFLEVSLLTATTSADTPEVGPFYTGDAFLAPSGDRDIDLVTAVLDGETSLALNSSKAPALIYAPDGLRYAIGRAAIQDLAEGDAVALSGRITLFAPDEGDEADPVRVYAAVIGASVPVAPAPSPAATVAPSGEASLSLTLTQCPTGSLAIPGGGATPAPCDPDGARLPVPGVVVTLENVATDATFTLTLDVNGGVTESIAAGSYRIVSFGDVPASTRAVIAECALIDPVEARPDMILVELPLADGDAVECQLYADDGTFAVEAPTSGPSVSFTVLICPSIYTDEFLNPPAQVDGLANCDGDLSLDEAQVFEEGLELVLVNGGGGTYRQTTGTDGTTVFPDLPPTNYTVNVILPDAALEFRGVCGATAADGTPLGLAGSISRTQTLAVTEGESLDCTVLALFPGPDGDDPVTAAVIVDVFACPDGTNLPTFQADSVFDCSALPAGQGINVALETPAGDVLNADSDGDSTAVFTDLPSGGYAIAVPDVDGGAYGLCGSSNGLAGLITSFAVGSGESIECSVYILNADDWVAYQDIDTDGDFLADAQEARLGTDPAVADTDGDGSVDGEEVYAGTDPLN